MTTATLPTWALDILAAVPHRGEGLNQWLMRAACALRRCGRTDADAIEELRILTAGEAVRHNEIERAVERSAQYVTDDNAMVRRAPSRWPKRDSAAIQRIARQMDGFGVADLWEQSPVRFHDASPWTETAIDLLFPGNPLICTAVDWESADTRPREEWRGQLASKQFIVPSAMSQLLGMTQEGRVSPRSLTNTGPRQYLVVEQDEGPPDQQACVIAHLADRAPLVLVVHSGGKSLHAWFRCQGQPEQRVEKFFRYAVALGADRATWTPCQLVRMPDGLRPKDDGRSVRQSILYYAPGVIGGNT